MGAVLEGRRARKQMRENPRFAKRASNMCIVTSASGRSGVAKRHSIQGKLTGVEEVLVVLLRRETLVEDEGDDGDEDQRHEQPARFHRGPRLGQRLIMHAPACLRDSRSGDV